MTLSNLKSVIAIMEKYCDPTEENTIGIKAVDGKNVLSIGTCRPLSEEDSKKLDELEWGK